MATQTATMNRPKQDSTVEQKIQELRELYADAPQYVKTALENATPWTDVAGVGAIRHLQTESAGRIGIRQGKVSELTVIAPFAPAEPSGCARCCGC